MTIYLDDDIGVHITACGSVQLYATLVSMTTVGHCSDFRIICFTSWLVQVNYNS